MNVNLVSAYSPKFRGDLKKDKPKSFLDKFETSVKNSADMNDTLQVPRTIFKGYLAFMVSTTMASLASFIKPKHAKIKNGINITAGLVALYGTFSFVRPYLIKGSCEKKS